MRAARAKGILAMRSEFVTALESRRLFSVAAHIRVLNNETTIEAGQSVHVSALAGKTGATTSFGSGDAITSKIQWNFNDPSGAYNRLPGFNAAHVYEKPGKYKLTLRVTNAAGETDTASRIINVVAPAHRMIYVNPWGNDANTGKTPGKAVATVTRAEQLLGDNTELLFRSGETFNVDDSISLPFSNVVIGAYGKGKTPKLLLKPSGNQYKVMFGMTGASHQITIENLLLEGSGSAAFGDAIHAGGTNIVIKGVDFENLDSAIVDASSPAGLLAYNNVAGTLRSYFAFVQGSDQAFLGNIAGDSTKQHNIRIYGSRILAYGNDLTNLPTGASLATLRVNNGTDIYWSNNVLHGGQLYVGPLGRPARRDGGPGRQQCGHRKQSLGRSAQALVRQRSRRGGSRHVRHHDPRQLHRCDQRRRDQRLDLYPGHVREKSRQSNGEQYSDSLQHRRQQRHERCIPVGGRRDATLDYAERFAVCRAGFEYWPQCKCGRARHRPR